MIRLTSKHLQQLRVDAACGGLKDKGTLANVISQADDANDLLIALQGAFSAFGKAGGNMKDGPFRAEWEMCRAAIAKATTDKSQSLVNPSQRGPLP